MLDPRSLNGSEVKYPTGYLELDRQSRLHSPLSTQLLLGTGVSNYSKVLLQELQIGFGCRNSVHPLSETVPFVLE